MIFFEIRVNNSSAASIRFCLSLIKSDKTGLVTNNDPLDVLVFNHDPIDRGSLVSCRILGVLGFVDGGEVDNKIIGGLIVKVGSKMIDSSIASKINKLKIVMEGT